MSDDVALPLADGRYELIRRIGVGGMATVYEGFDTRLQVKRAIKILDPSFLARKNIRARFEAEARTMARLTHKHIVTVQDVGRDGDRAYIVMELIEGGSFSDLIDRHGPLSVVVACTGVADMLEALEFAHAAGVIHRDVKPHNMLIAADGTAKLGDFGIAMLSADDARSTTRTGMSMGTPAYMPPEQMADTKSVGPTADIFAAGATLYTLITGREANNIFATEVREAVLRDVPADVAAVIRRATQYQPEDRYATAHEMREALLEVIAHAPPDDGAQPRPRPRAVTPPNSATHWQLLATEESRPIPAKGRSPTVRAALLGGSAAIVVVLVGLIAVLAVGRATDARDVASANERGAALIDQAEAAGLAGDWATASRLVDDALEIRTTDEQLIARESAFALRAHREMLVMSANAALSSGDLAEAERRVRALPDGDPDAAVLLAEIQRRAAPPPSEPVAEPPLAAAQPVIGPKPASVAARATPVAVPPVAVVATAPVPAIVPAVVTPPPDPVPVDVPAVVVPATTPAVPAPDPAAVAAAARATLPERVQARSLDDMKHALERIEYAAAKGGFADAGGATTLLAEDLIGSFAPGVTFDIYPRSLFDAIAASQGLPEAKVRGAVRRANHP